MGLFFANTLYMEISTLNNYFFHFDKKQIHRYIITNYVYHLKHHDLIMKWKMGKPQLIDNEYKVFNKIIYSNMIGFSRNL